VEKYVNFFNQLQKNLVSMLLSDDMVSGHVISEPGPLDLSPYPSTLLKYVPTAYFLLPLAKLLPLTNGPKKDEGRKDEGRIFLRLTDWTQVERLLSDNDYFLHLKSLLKGIVS
jgi:hypothetical protein